jgi:hypothetical protein
MQIPPTVIQAARDAEARFPSDLDAATDAAVVAVQAHPDYPTFVDTLVRERVRDIVHQVRHEKNKQIKRELKQYGQPAKVDFSKSVVVQESAQSVYDYRLGGTLLGDLTGDGLSRVIESEAAAARGHQFHVALGRWLQKRGVTGDKRVRDVVPETVLRKQMDKLQDEILGVPA